MTNKRIDTYDNEATIKLENQFCFQLYSASNAMTRAYRPLLNELDLTYPQYLVMLVLWEQDNLPLKDLGVKLLLDSGTLTPLIKRLEKKGIVVRKHHEQDERVRMIALTEQGLALKEKALLVPQALRCQMDIGIEELMNLKETCEKIIHELS